MPRRLKVTLTELEPGSTALDYDGRLKLISGDDRGLVAHADGAEVGFMIFRPCDGESLLGSGRFVHLYSAWVAPHVRRRRVFTQMSAYLVERYPEHRMQGFPVDEYGAVRRFLKRSSRNPAGYR